MRDKINEDFYMDTGKIIAWFVTQYGIEYLVGDKWHFLEEDLGKSLEDFLRKIDESDHEFMKAK